MAHIVSAGVVVSGVLRLDSALAGWAFSTFGVLGVSMYKIEAARGVCNVQVRM